MTKQTSFSRYYDCQGHLQNYSMDSVSKLIKDQNNKKLIAEIIYHRFYNRYLKLFFFKSTTQKYYSYDQSKKLKRNEFKTEYKSGFIITASCCFVIEALSTFLSGKDRSDKSGHATFEIVFQKAKDYKNDLKVFSNEPIYKYIRNGLLHQGETYGKFTITRKPDTLLYDKNSKTLNATLFGEATKDFLDSYKRDLEDSSWDSEIWDNCRVKIRYIIKNSQ